MDHEMKLSPTAVRQLRIARGWSQEQLAIAAGLSQRTVQRVEAEGLASLATAASLAATYAVPLVELQEAPPAAMPAPAPRSAGRFCLGVAMLMVAAIGESGRLPGSPQADALAAVNLLAAAAAAILLVPALVRLVRARQSLAATLAAIGVPFLTLLAAGLVVAALAGRTPTWPLLGLGAGGGALVLMAFRAFRRGGRTAGI